MNRSIQHNADIAAEIREGLAQLILCHMNGSGGAADCSGIDAIFVRINSDIFGDAIEGIQTADRAYVQGAVRIDVSYHQSDIIQVSSDGNGIPFAAKIGDNSSFMELLIREPHLIQHLADQIADLLILTGGAVNRQQALKHIQSFLFMKNRQNR